MDICNNTRETKQLTYFHLSDPAVLPWVLQAGRLFLFLDFDGTLAEIAPTPPEVFLKPQHRRCLENLAAAPDFLVAIVTGRRLDEARDLVGVRTIFYVGLHGLEFITPCGERISYPVGREVADSLQSLREYLARRLSTIPEIFLEDKGLSLALHFRLAKKAKTVEVTEALVHAVDSYRERGIPLEILRGKEMIEVRPAGRNKGYTVTELLARYGSGALPIYIGDDVTDESAFGSLKPPAMTILVSEAPRPTLADYYLRNLDEVYALLRDLIAERVKRL